MKRLPLLVVVFVTATLAFATTTNAQSQSYSNVDLVTAFGNPDMYFSHTSYFNFKNGFLVKKKKVQILATGDTITLVYISTPDQLFVKPIKYIVWLTNGPVTNSGLVNLEGARFDGAYNVSGKATTFTKANAKNDSNVVSVLYTFSGGKLVPSKDRHPYDERK